MPQYMKTTGSLVTVKPKKESAANQGRMLLDDALIEMLDIMLPVGELKTFATDETDSWIAKMAEYNQEWAEPDGRLLKVSDYPDLFNLIGYNYGWSNTNPNSTYTYSFTDVNGVARSLQIYSDLDIDGNAKPVEGSPAYFRIPNLAGRFLRSAGTATYVNKWTDTDGNVRHLLTEYSAPMYKGQLDAIRDITGAHEAVSDTFSAWATNYKGDGAILDITVYDEPYCRVATTSTDSHSNGFSFDAARVVPATIENRSLAQVTRIILRIA